MLPEVQTERDLREKLSENSAEIVVEHKNRNFHLSQRNFEVMNGLMILSHAACQVLVLNYAFNL